MSTIPQCLEKEVNGKRYRCFFELSLLIVGGKWKPVIIYHLAQSGVLRYGELKRTMPGISERMLSKQLKELEDDSIVMRRAYPEIPPRVEYRLTELGSKLIPVLLALRGFGVEYEKHIGGGHLVYDPEEYEGLEIPFAPGPVD